MPSRSMAGAWRRRLAGAFIGYVFVALVLTHPLVWHLSSVVPHDLGDPLLSVAVLWWNAHVVPLTLRWWNGFAFWPSSGVLAFSDHRLGESLLATPLQWAGFSALTAYNITLLATFPLCAIAAHWLVYTLTGRHDAALVAGLAYGFNPYRVAHIEHLELLAAFGMPAALAALHLYARHRRVRWLVVFAIAVLVQALSCSYYGLFFLVMVALWAAWFLRWGDRDLLVGVGAAVAAFLIVVSPLAWTYTAIHHHYGFARGFTEIITFSADLTSLVTASPLVAIWGWTSPLNGPERQLFPGATLALLAAAGVFAAIRSRRGSAAENRLSLVLVGSACVFSLVALSAWVHGPWHIGNVLSVSVPFKPLSLAFWALVAAVAASSWVRGAFRRRSAFTFYLLASALLFLLSLGPKPAFLGSQFLYEPPYAWLMRLSVFGDSIRVPARFAMPAILALSVSGGLALARIHRRGAWSSVLVYAIAAGVVADAWPARLPLLDPPPAWPVDVRTAGMAAFVELPLGEINRDVAAMYRSTMTRVPTVNGYSGHEPSYYEALRIALDERDDSVLEALASKGQLLVVIDRRAEGGVERLEWLRSNSRATAIAEDSGRTWFAVSAFSTMPVRCSALLLPIEAVSDNEGPVDLAMLTDHDDSTFWITGEPQQAGDALVIDLGRVLEPCSIRLTLGTHPALFPRLLSVATSEEGQSWRTLFVGRTGGQAVLAGIASPRDARLEIGLKGRVARFIRLRLEASHPTIPWIVTELAVTALPQE